MHSVFRWNGWNLEHATRHGVSVMEIERVVRSNPARQVGGKKWMAIGRGQGGRMVRAVFVIDPDGKTAFVIHAMPLTTRRRPRR